MNIFNNIDTIKAQNSSFDAEFKFSGKPLDTETGFYYFGARYLDANMGIWLSVDPLAEKYPGLSSYNYCANNPVMLMDPDGEKIVIVGDAKKQYFKQVKFGAKSLGISVRIDKTGTLNAKFKGKGEITENGQKFLDAVS